MKEERKNDENNNDNNRYYIDWYSSIKYLGLKIIISLTMFVGFMLYKLRNPIDLTRPCFYDYLH